MRNTWVLFWGSGHYLAWFLCRWLAEQVIGAGAVMEGGDLTSWDLAYCWLCLFSLSHMVICWGSMCWAAVTWQKALDCGPWLWAQCFWISRHKHVWLRAKRYCPMPARTPICRTVHLPYTLSWWASVDVWGIWWQRGTGAQPPWGGTLVARSSAPSLYSLSCSHLVYWPLLVWRRKSHSYGPRRSLTRSTSAWTKFTRLSSSRRRWSWELQSLPRTPVMKAAVTSPPKTLFPQPAAFKN